MPVLFVLLLQIYISQARGQTPAQVQPVVKSQVQATVESSVLVPIEPSQMQSGLADATIISSQTELMVVDPTVVSNQTQPVAVDPTVISSQTQPEAVDPTVISSQTQLVVASSTTDSIMLQLFLENKKKRGRLMALYSQSNLPEERVALKIELHFIENLMAKQLSTETNVEINAEVNANKFSVHQEQQSVKTNIAFVNSQLSVCELKLLDKSLRDLERIYLPQAPVNKFWEGVVLLQRELPHINAWLSKLEGLTYNNIGVIDPIDAAEVFKALREGAAAISVFESLQRLEQFLESERVTLIFKYAESQNIVAETYSQLHTIIENIKQVERKEKSQEMALLAIAGISNSKNKITNYKERIDFILRVILEDIIFRDEYKTKRDIEVLAAIDNINYQLATQKIRGISDLRKILEIAQTVDSEAALRTARAMLADQTVSQSVTQLQAQAIVQDQVTAKLAAQAKAAQAKTEPAKSNLNCESEAISAQNSVFQSDEAMDFTSPVFEAIAISAAEVKSVGKTSIAPILKPWTFYIDPVCLQLKQWQTNHNFWCNSDLQEGCERGSASLCKSVN